MNSVFNVILKCSSDQEVPEEQRSVPISGCAESVILSREVAIVSDVRQILFVSEQEDGGGERRGDPLVDAGGHRLYFRNREIEGR